MHNHNALLEIVDCTDHCAEGNEKDVQYIADRRLEKLRLPRLYNSENPFPWMSEVIDLKKEKDVSD